MPGGTEAPAIPAARAHKVIAIMKGPPPGGRGVTTRLRTAKGRTTASQKWLERQLNDPYVRAAQARGYRSRAAFKLVEMDEKAKLLRPGARIVDLGADRKSTRLNSSHANISYAVFCLKKKKKKTIRNK